MPQFSKRVAQRSPRRRKKPAASERPPEAPAREELRAASRAQLGRDEEARPPRARDEDASIEDPLGDWPEH